MLNFPLWKVGLIAAALLWGAILAVPNLLSDGFLGIEPREPSDLTNQAAVAAYEQQLSEAEDSWWFLPGSKLNLGLDLQGGVYLLMEIQPEEIATNRLNLFQGDVRNAWAQRGDRDTILRDREVNIANGRMTYRLRDADRQMNDAISRLRRVNPTIGTTQTELFNISEGANGTVVISVPNSALAALAKDAQGKMMTIIRRRVDPDGVAEIAITPQGDTRIILEAPGEADPKRIKEILGKAGRLTFNMANLDQSAIRAAVSTGNPQPGFELIDSMEGGSILINTIPELTGADINSANRCFDEANRPAVCFGMNSSAATKFFNLTRANSGRFFSIVLDGVSMSAPRINQPISGGNVIIEGTFTIEEADDLSAIIEAGELPAKLNFLDERTVGPTLGAESIAAGSRASMIGIILVGVFMVLAYGLIGGFAVGSLIANIVLIIGALSGFGATLTLPGIAGIILTIGMAVDANVIVFERIREEQSNGRSPATAIQAGYERAFSAILDANITTFIAASILYLVGSGPVKGFAVTLAIGIITSVFTAFVVTRWFTVMYLRTFRPKRLAM